MRKLYALLLVLMMSLTLAACGGKDDEKVPSSEAKTPSSSEQQEQNTPDTNEGEDEPEETPDNSGEATDPGTSGSAGGSTIADCNAALDGMGITGFRFPEDLTAAECKVYMGGSGIQVKYCPVEKDRYEEILQSLFSDTGLTTTNAFGDAITTLDEAVGMDSNDKKPNHGFDLNGNDRTFSVTVFYYPAEYNDGIQTYEAQTLSISINEVW